MTLAGLEPLPAFGAASLMQINPEMFEGAPGIVVGFLLTLYVGVYVYKQVVEPKLNGKADYVERRSATAKMAQRVEEMWRTIEREPDGVPNGRLAWRDPEVCELLQELVQEIRADRKSRDQQTDVLVTRIVERVDTIESNLLGAISDIVA